MQQQQRGHVCNEPELENFGATSKFQQFTKIDVLQNGDADMFSCFVSVHKKKQPKDVVVTWHTTTTKTPIRSVSEHVQHESEHCTESLCTVPTDPRTTTRLAIGVVAPSRRMQVGIMHFVRN